MKIRTLCIACVTTAAALLAGCTAVYKNTDACEQLMRSKLAEVPADQFPEASVGKLSIDHTGTGIGGARVVVEASLSHMQTASEAVVAAAPKGASAAHATAARAASDADVGTAANAASGAAATVTATTLASGVSGASAASAASAPQAAGKPAKPVKPKKIVTAAAAECTFAGLNLASFRWLSPAALVKTNEGTDSDTAE
ncbi:hypothetical protein [Paraburkholderia sp.]|uniref:hypothetical protein n=1 Tax=Paraburkholderia sp. TaxID=1926495 RepID=UPI002F428931